jgi:myo-inositol-1(or 4)-monophosphatase
MTDYTSLLEQALSVAEEAATFIRENAGKVGHEDIIIKSENSLVSYVDKKAEEILVKGLRDLLPDSGFITEEDTVARQASAYTWIIDPLDGTTNFLHNLPMYSVSVGLEHRGEIVLGIIINVALGETFYATAGGGAWCNGERIQVSRTTAVGEALVATGFPYETRDMLPGLTSALQYFLQYARGVRRLGSAAIDLAYVACGRFDLYYETTLNPWDIAAGIILVREAGGVVTDFSGGSAMLANGQILAGAPEIHKAVAGQIRSRFNIMS